MAKRKKLGFIFGLIVIVGLCFQVIIRSGSFGPFIYQILFNPTIELKKENNQINILLLGIAGGTHEGPSLTDSIIFANVNTKNSAITLFSLPRDMWSTDLKGRINTAYAIGESKRRGGGIILAKAEVQKIVGQNVDYAILIDFNGFIKAVNLLGGIDISIERTFDDYEYPIEGKENDPCDNKPEDLEKLASASSQLETFPCRYLHIHFDKGSTHMDGETALRYVRSRHAKGEEGTDFARSKRQEKVINAFKDKMLSLQIIINPAKVIGLYQTIEASVDTDIIQNEFDDFIKLAQRLQKAKMRSVVIDYGNKETGRPGLLTHPLVSKEYNFEWTLIPRVGKDNYSEIQEYINCELTKGNCIISQLP